MENNGHDNYMFFSSQELIDYFQNSLREKDIKTQCKRIFEMARVFMDKKDFVLEDIYSIAVMLRDIKDCSVIDEVFKLYFKPNRYPVRVVIQLEQIEDTADVEMEFSAYRGEKKFINYTGDQVNYIPASEAVIIENVVHTSGIGPMTDKTGIQAEGDISEQVRQCIDKIATLLNTSGSSLEKAYSIILYIKDVSLLTKIEEIFSNYCFEEKDISQQVFEVRKLIEDYEIEISCSANLN